MAADIGDRSRPGAEGARPASVAIASVGDPRLPTTWSGSTAGVIGGLEQLGVSVVTIDVSLSRGLERAMLAVAALPTRNRFDAEGAALVAAVRTARARLALAGTAVDGVVQIGTTFALPEGTRFVTLEDMTLRQAQEVHPVFSRMSDTGAAAWERRRARIYAAARTCAAGSCWTADSLRSDYGIAPERIAIIGFGANHSPVPAARDWNVPHFLFVGIDWERKGGPLLLRAFARVRERIPAATLDVIGGHPPLRQDGVRFHGVLSQRREDERARIQQLFASATCFVMPSLVEPFGMVYVEAAAAGIASIGSSVGGAADVIGADGGLIVEPSDGEALLAAMLWLAEPATARRMGAAAHGRAAAYTWPKVAERLLRALGLSAADDRAVAEPL
jgi:hypothetical protein